MSDSTIQPPPPPPPSPPPGTTGPAGPQAAAGATSNRAIVALVLGVLSLICCQPLGPVAWYIGNQELQAIQAGLVPESNRVIALIGMILGIIATVMLVLGLLWIIFLGGLATLGSIMGW